MCDYSKYQRYAMIVLGIAMMTGFIGDPPLLSYGATRLNRPANSGKDSTPVVVNAISIDNSDPVHSTIEYKANGQGKILNVVFSAPGQSAITAASKSGTLSFTFNQKSFSKGANYLKLNYDSASGHQQRTVTAERIEYATNPSHRPGFYVTTWVDGEPTRSINYSYDLTETYDAYSYTCQVIGNNNIWVGSSDLELTPLQGDNMLGATGVMSSGATHWYSDSQNSSMLSQDMGDTDYPIVTSPDDVSLFSYSDSTFGTGVSLTGNSDVTKLLLKDAFGPLFGNFLPTGNSVLIKQ